MRPLLLALLVLASCGSDAKPPTTGSCSSPACTSHVAVARALAFANAQPDGTSVGFDLDHKTSDESDSSTCGQVDFKSPEGTPGIDNQFAMVADSLTRIAGDAVQGLIRGAINDGTLLLLISLDGVDDPAHDDCVGVSLIPAVGNPFVGTDGLLAEGQTFDPDPATPSGHFECGTMRDGVVTAGPFDALLPFQVLAVHGTLRVHGAMVRATLHPDGSVDAMLGAAVEIAQVSALGHEPGALQDGEVALLDLLLKSIADLAPDADGKCQQLSVTILIEGARAFLFPGDHT